VREVIPVEIRVAGIAAFYAVGTGVDGVFGPWLFGTLIGAELRARIFSSYALAATPTIGAAAIEWL
jgi:hypothetical protein